MANLSNYWRDQLLNAARNVAPTLPAALYLALCSGAPVASDTGATLTSGSKELTSTGGYARISIAFSAASGGSITNTTATGTVSTAAFSAASNYWAILDSATIGAGNMYFYGPIQGINDVQTISTSAQLTAGTYTITYLGGTTPAINYNDPASRILPLLESIAGVGEGNVTVAFSGNRFDQVTPGTLIVTAIGTLASTSETLLTITPSGITGGTLSAAHTTTGAPGTVTISGANQTPSVPASNCTIALG